jgi:beta-galactosidase GanA
MRNVFEKVVQKIKTHILHSITFSPENRAVCEIMWGKYGREGQVTDGNTIQRMWIACWIT